MDAIFVNYSDEEIWKANKKPPLHLDKEKNRKNRWNLVSILLHNITFLYPGGKTTSLHDKKIRYWLNMKAEAASILGQRNLIPSYD